MINNLSIIVCDTCKKPGPAAYTAPQARAAAAADGWRTFRSRLGPGDMCPDCRADTGAERPPSPPPAMGAAPRLIGR